MFNPKIEIEFDPDTGEAVPGIILCYNTPAQLRRLQAFLKRNFPQGLAETGGLNETGASNAPCEARKKGIGTAQGMTQEKKETLVTVKGQPKKEVVPCRAFKRVTSFLLWEFRIYPEGLE